MHSVCVERTIVLGNGKYHCKMGLSTDEEEFQAIFIVEIVFEDQNEDSVERVFDGIRMKYYHNDFPTIVRCITEFITPKKEIKEVDDFFTRVHRVPRLALALKEINVDKKLISEYKQKIEMIAVDAECAVCFTENSVDSIFMPCMHTICCKNCSKQIKTCPICRAKINLSIFAEIIPHNRDEPADFLDDMRKLLIEEQFKRIEICSDAFFQKELAIKITGEIDANYVDQFYSDDELTPAQKRSIEICKDSDVAGSIAVAIMAALSNA